MCARARARYGIDVAAVSATGNGAVYSWQLSESSNREPS